MRIVLLIYASAPAGANEDIFPQRQVRQWAHDLRTVANKLEGDHDLRELAEHIYNVHYAIGPDTDPADYDPFGLDEDYLALEASGGREGLVTSLRAVIENGERCVDAAIWDGGLRDYLEQLLNRIEGVPFELL